MNKIVAVTLTVQQKVTYIVPFDESQPSPNYNAIVYAKRLFNKNIQAQKRTKEKIVGNTSPKDVTGKFAGAQFLR